jgi:ADP-ribose pyrophosphatase YjhB (NUDIX family)
METKEEAGLEVAPVKLLAILDKSKHLHPPSPFHVYKIFIMCNLVGGELGGGTETLGADFFDLTNLPELSTDRITHAQITLMYDFLNNPNKAVIFD